MTAISLFFAAEPLLNLAAVSLLVLLSAFVVAAIIVVVGGWAYPKLKGQHQGYAYEKQIEALLLPFIYQAIFNAYKLSEHALDEVGRRLDGIDKKYVAGFLYDALPNKLGNVDIAFIKLAISRERFTVLVQEAFDEMLEFYDSQEDHYAELFEEWVLLNK